MSVEPLVLSAVISGAGGVLLETLLRRKDVVDFEALVRNLEVPEKTFNAFHPAMSLIQMSWMSPTR